MGKRRRVEIETRAPDQGAPPFVCYFPTGPPSTSGQDEAVQFTIYENPSVKSTIVVGSKGNMDYVGNTAGSEYAGPQPCSYAVAVYDKEAGKLQLLPVQGGKVCRMEARLHALDYGASGQDVQAADTREARLAMNKRLVDSFGSTRRRRELNAKEEGIVRAEKLTGQSAIVDLLRQQAAKAAAEGMSKEAVMKRSAESRNLPPHHPEASVLEAAYRLDELVPGGNMGALEVAKLLRAVEEEEARQKAERYFPPYVVSRLELLHDPDKSKAKQRAHALALVAALLNMAAARPSLKCDDKTGLTQLASRLRMREELLAELLSTFYVHSRDGNQDKYERPSQQHNLLLAYLLVAVMLAEGGMLAAQQFEALRLELKMDPQDLATRFREIGATCSAAQVKEEEGAARRSYRVTLLPGGSTKPLGECFPPPKLGKRK